MHGFAQIFWFVVLILPRIAWNWLKGERPAPSEPHTLMAAGLVGGPMPMMARSPKWPALRAAHLEREPDCQVCGTRDGVEVHHCLPVHTHPELELNAANLVSLCLPHHLLAGHLMLWRSWNPNVRADIAAWRAKIKGRP